jgi:carbon monoxide dehydrogenase subunit G
VELNNEFEVKAPIDRAWATLTDLEKIAPCLPGAQLQEVEGDEYRGIVKVKVGPITAQYKGAATFVEKDDANHRAVLKADGRDTRGAGNASANITAQLVSLGESTKVTVNTDLTVTGKVAQFGRGVMADVSAKLMGQFADNLEQLMASESAAADAAEGAAAAEAAPAASSANGASAAPASAPAASTTAPSSTGAPAASGVRKIDAPAAKPVDLLDTAGSPVMKRLAPVIAAIVALLLVRRLRRKG